MTTLMQVHGRHSCWQLEASCIEFLASNSNVYEAMEATEEYKELEQDCGAFVNEVTKKVAKRAVARNSPSSSSTSGGSLLHPHKSMSRYNPYKLVRGRHDFLIENLSAVRQINTSRVDEYIRSGTFKVGDYEWAIDVKPWVKDEDDREHIGIYLMLMNAPAADVNVKASACFRINEASPVFSHEVGDISVYTKVGQSHGNTQFITLESATSKCIEHGGSLTVHAEVLVATESLASTAGTSVGAVTVVPPTNLSWHLEQLLASEQGSDVKFHVEESDVRAHRLVIAARSPVLHKAVESTTNTELIVRIDGMTVRVFKAMLHFVYTDELPCMDDLSAGDFTTVAGDMLAAACRFRLERMKRLCMNLLAEKVTTVSSALATLKVARRHNCPELEEYCRQYMLLPHVASKVTQTCIRLFLESQLA
jgi:speckle-type POZ protein